MPRIAYHMIEAYVFRRGPRGAEFLLMRRASSEWLPGTWQSIYGGIKENERAWQAALREIREETGLRPIAFYQLDQINSFYVASEDTVYHNAVFVAEAAPDAEVILDHEHDTFVWLPPEQAIPKFTWPSQRSAVREIMSEIVTPGPATEHLRIRVE